MNFIDIEKDRIEKLKARLQELEQELGPYLPDDMTPETHRKILAAQRKLGMRRCR